MEMMVVDGGMIVVWASADGVEQKSHQAAVVHQNLVILSFPFLALVALPENLKNDITSDKETNTTHMQPLNIKKKA